MVVSVVYGHAEPDRPVNIRQQYGSTCHMRCHEFPNETAVHGVVYAKLTAVVYDAYQRGLTDE